MYAAYAIARVVLIRFLRLSAHVSSRWQRRFTGGRGAFNTMSTHGSRMLSSYSTVLVNWQLSRTPNVCNVSLLQFSIFIMILLIRGAFKKFVDWRSNYEIRTSYFVTFQLNCNWNAFGPAFLQSSDTVVEELLFLVFQPAICLAIRTRMANTVGDGVVQSRITASALADLWSDALSWLQVTSVFPKLKELMKRHKIFWQRGCYLHGIWLAGRPRTTILIQRYPALDQVHFSCRCLCWKVTKYDVRISQLTVSDYELVDACGFRETVRHI